MKVEVLKDLPPKVYSTRTVEVKLSSPQDLLELAMEAGERKLTQPEIAKLVLWRTECASKKIPAMLEIVEEFEEEQIPLVVFSAFRAPIDALATRHGWGVITGDVSHEERARIVADFQSGGLRGIALTIAAGGVGITLTEASNVLFVDRDWNPSSNSQAEDRCNRIGQTASSVQILDLVADNAVDRAVSASIAKKQGWFNGAVDDAHNAAPLIAATYKSQLERAGIEVSQ
jgi:SNF2 family DNA or RNA helicase